jgi:hypothetical protein
MGDLRGCDLQERAIMQASVDGPQSTVNATFTGMIYVLIVPIIPTPAMLGMVLGAFEEREE